MIKVMHVLNTGSYSGAENVVITLINATKEDVNSCYVSLDGPIREYLKENKISFESIKKMTVREIRRVIKRENPDVIHAHDFTAGVMCAATFTRVPIINHLHNNSPWIKRYNLRSFCYALSCLRYKKILTVSDSIMKEYVFGSTFLKKTTVVGNPVDIQKIRKMAGNEEKRYDIAFLGRFSPPKNPHLFLDIIKDVKKTKPDVSVIMIGDGEMKREIESRIRDEGLSGNIVCVGFQKNPYRFLAQAKLLLMPSAWEGYGLAAVEALALGLPVICSNAGGLPEIVDESCGKICTEKEEYGNRIVELLCDITKLKKLSINAYSIANQSFNLEYYSEKLIKIYNSCLTSNA